MAVPGCVIPKKSERRARSNPSATLTKIFYFLQPSACPRALGGSLISGFLGKRQDPALPSGTTFPEVFRAALGMGNSSGSDRSRSDLIREVFLSLSEGWAQRSTSPVFLEVLGGPFAPA